MTNDQSISIGGHEIELSNLDKTFFPESGITKGDLIDYYERIAATALPHYRDRPLSMQRFPDGIAKDGFFQKDLPDYFPDWVDRVRLKKEGGSVTYAVANNAATLVYIANQGCITPHLSLARRDKPEHPDRLVIDLDPSTSDFGKVVFAARRVKQLLDELDLTSFVQTTGSRGLHVVVALDRSANFDQARRFARSFVGLLATRHPQTLTIEQRKSKRGEAVFLDYMRNAYGQTAVAPYAARALENAPVATPLDWSELDSDGLNPQKYTVGNIFRRLGQKDDPWAGIERHGQSLAQAASALDALSRDQTAAAAGSQSRDKKTGK